MHNRCSLCHLLAAVEIFHGRQNDLYGFVDIEKVFDKVPQKIICWVSRKHGLEKWIVKLVQRT